jgi:methylated-DNA-[protein]-cysteine S-methyltransferase
VIPNPADLADRVVYWTSVESPIGPLLLAGDRETLRVLWFGHGRKAQGPRPEWVESAAEFRGVAQQLREYFAGARQRFEVTLAPQGTTFQQTVWRALQDIPYGETTSYGELARRIGDVKATRAVWARQRRQSHRHRDPVPPRDWRRRRADGLRRGLTKRALLDLEQGQRTLL